MNTLNTEFFFYNALIKKWYPRMSLYLDKEKILYWVRKLLSPEYHTTKLREKRNRYLLYLVLSILNDDVYGILNTLPPLGPLEPFNRLPVIPHSAPKWKKNNIWQELIKDLPLEQKIACTNHESQEECDNEHHLDNLCDEEFQFFLYLAYPYQRQLSDKNERTKVATWFQFLAAINGEMYCSSMKMIRNDYIKMLLGYLSNSQVAGPFTEVPQWKSLISLDKAAKLSSNGKIPIATITDPTGCEAEDFLKSQPRIEEGAFCYIAVTGELLDAIISK